MWSSSTTATFWTQSTMKFSHATAEKKMTAQYLVPAGHQPLCALPKFAQTRQNMSITAVPRGKWKPTSKDMRQHSDTEDTSMKLNFQIYLETKWSISGLHDWVVCRDDCLSVQMRCSTLRPVPLREDDDCAIKPQRSAELKVRTCVEIPTWK